MAQKPLYNLQTNEEIIEELTKDLETSCLNGKDGKSKEKVVMENCSDNDEPWENAGKEPDEEYETAEESKTPENDIDQDSSDEELLKDRDSNLTEAEKEVSI